MNKLDLTGKIILITGANGGIGAAIAKKIIDCNGTPVLHFNRNEENIKEFINTQKKKNIDIHAYKFDICNEKAVKEGIRNIKNDFGRIDALVNNAGILSRGFIPTLSLNTLNNIIDTNVIGNFSVLKNVVQLMIEQKCGNIVNISSLAASFGLKGQVAYSMSKAAINALTKIAAKELSMYNIRVNAVSPGYVKTGMLENPTVQDLEYMQKIPLKRYAHDYEIADLVAFLLSDLSAYIIGQIIIIDGGLSVSI